ncbi:MAG: CotS family spore coat protein [Tumebacillaceae bacterium]
MGKKEERELLEAFEEYGADPEVLAEWELAVQKVKAVRGVLKLRTSAGYRMLKKVNVSHARLRFIHEAIDHVANNGFKNVPRFIRTKYGDPYVVHPTGLYYLTDWFSGKEADLKKPKNLFLAAESLARFHNAGTGYDGGGFGQETREDFSATWSKYRVKLDSYSDHLAEKSEPSAMDELFAEYRGELAKMIDHSSEQLGKSPYGAVLEWARDHKSICHGSFSRQNLVVDKERMQVVDFDHCHFGHPIHDLGALLARYMPRNKWDAEIGFSIIDVYRGVRELTTEEMTVLAAYLSFPQRTLQLVESYFESTRDWKPEKFAERFKKSLALDRGRETFVQELIDRYDLKMAAPSFASGLEGIESYDTYEEMESSSVENRDDGWQEVEASMTSPVDVQEQEVTLVRFDEDNEPASPKPRNRPKVKRPAQQQQLERKGLNPKPGLWTPRK